jgi:hypothetical protein
MGNSQRSFLALLVSRLEPSRKFYVRWEWGIPLHLKVNWYPGNPAIVVCDHGNNNQWRPRRSRFSAEPAEPTELPAADRPRWLRPAGNGTQAGETEHRQVANHTLRSRISRATIHLHRSDPRLTALVNCPVGSIKVPHIRPEFHSLDLDDERGVFRRKEPIIAHMDSHRSLPGIHRLKPSVLGFSRDHGLVRKRRPEADPQLEVRDARRHRVCQVSNYRGNDCQQECRGREDIANLRQPLGATGAGPPQQNPCNHRCRDRCSHQEQDCGAHDFAPQPYITPHAANNAEFELFVRIHISVYQFAGS